MRRKITLTESQLNKVILNTAKRLIREGLINEEYSVRFYRRGEEQFEPETETKVRSLPAAKAYVKRQCQTKGDDWGKIDIFDLDSYKVVATEHPKAKKKTTKKPKNNPNTGESLYN